MPACFDLFWVIRTMIGATKVERADCSALLGKRGNKREVSIMNGYCNWYTSCLVYPHVAFCTPRKPRKVGRSQVARRFRHVTSPCLPPLHYLHRVQKDVDVGDISPLNQTIDTLYF